MTYLRIKNDHINLKTRIMKKIKRWTAWAVAAAFALPSSAEEKATSNGYPYSQVPFTAVKVTPSTFWGDRIKAAREVTIPLAFSKCETQNRYSNFTKAAYTLQHPGHAGLQTKAYDVPTFMGFSFDDTDVYKTIEGASYVLQTYPDERLKSYIDSVIAIVGAAQEPDGYLNTARTINPDKPHSWAGKTRWSKEEVLSHELYNLGHMVDAACAHYQATGKTNFLDIAKRYADCVVKEVGPRENQATVVPGHQIAEMALCRLYLITGEKKYLDEAKFLLDYRGKTKVRNHYSQSHQPVIEQKEAVGHAVRAGYMYAGMADVAALTGDSAYINAIETICENIISKKYYLTGGVGATHSGEAFDANYVLPNLTAYNETCAAISMIYLFERMFLFKGDARYIDCLERTLYNGVISGMSIDGGRFFYPNPLSADGKYKFNADNTNTRQPWFGCACCPSNLSRFIPSVPGYVYGVKDNTLFVNLFLGNTANIRIGGKEVVLQQQTQYPWEGDVAIKVVSTKTKDFEMKIRIPGWVRNEVVPSDLYTFNDNEQTGYSVEVNGEKMESKIEKGYFSLKRKWKKGDVVKVHFDMKPRTVTANAKVRDDRGRVAIERGPLVYCAEEADHLGMDVHHFFLGEQPRMKVEEKEIKNTEGDNGVFKVQSVVVENAQLMETDSQGRLSVKNVPLRLIPYFAWNHRGAGKMDVWFASSLDVLN